MKKQTKNIIIGGLIVIAVLTLILTGGKPFAIFFADGQTLYSSYSWSSGTLTYSGVVEVNVGTNFMHSLHVGATSYFPGQKFCKTNELMPGTGLCVEEFTDSDWYDMQTNYECSISGNVQGYSTRTNSLQSCSTSYAIRGKIVNSKENPGCEITEKSTEDLATILSQSCPYMDAMKLSNAQVVFKRVTSKDIQETQQYHISEITEQPEQISVNYSQVVEKVPSRLPFIIGLSVVILLIVLIVVYFRRR